MTLPSLSQAAIYSGLFGGKWAGGANLLLTYSIPTQNPAPASGWAGYDSSNPNLDEPWAGFGLLNAFDSVTPVQYRASTAFRTIMEMYDSYVKASFVETNDATNPGAIRAAFTTGPSGAWGFVKQLPSSGGTPASDVGPIGDIWISRQSYGYGWDGYNHGGDWGGFVTNQLAHKYPNSVLGMHVLGGAPLDAFNKALPGADAYAPDEVGWFEKTAHFFAKESGYSAIQSTKPQTLSYGLTDSPVGLAAWLIEKRRSWSDCDGDVERRFTKTELLTSIMIYWMTGTIGTSARFYYETWKAPWIPTHADLPPIKPPAGFLKLEHDVCHWPRSAIESFFNVQRWTRSNDGGHFAPAEVPELVVAELREFFRPLRAGAR